MIATEAFDIAAWVDPLAGTEDLSLEELQQRVAEGMTVDITEAVAAWDSPLKAGLWAISAGRKPSAIATENGRGARGRTVHPDGALDERLHIVGIPTGKQWADTTISPMPGTDPLMLQETDKTARSLLTQAGLI
ncbi:hypothetical protein A0K93_05175 [Corynebacterium sp. BCW_4722]|nr:hypothetical protein A0K93_05175 [Corynebacterium sp. BCW_4722]